MQWYPALKSFLSRQTQGITGTLCVDFGSMGKMGLLSDPFHLVATVLEAVKSTNMQAIILTGSVTAIQSDNDI